MAVMIANAGYSLLAAVRTALLIEATLAGGLAIGMLIPRMCGQ